MDYSILNPIDLFLFYVGDGSAKCGSYYRDDNTDRIVSIQCWHGLPYTDDSSCVICKVENELVKEIHKR